MFRVLLWGLQRLDESVGKELCALLAVLTVLDKGMTVSQCALDKK